VCDERHPGGYRVYSAQGRWAATRAGSSGARAGFSRGAVCTTWQSMGWRELTEDDDDRVVEHMLGLYAEDPAPAPVSAEQCRRTLQRLRAERVRGVAIGWQGPHGLAGYAILCSFWSNELGGEVCIIDELFVAPGERGRGHATELVQGLCARQLPWFRDAVAVELEVTPGNERARQLYERLGFRPYKNALMRAARARG